MSKHGRWSPILLIAGACSGGAPSSDAFISQYCDLLAPCCQKAGLASDGRQCRAVFTAFSGLGGQYDASSGTACINALKTAASQPTFCDSSGGPSPPECKTVYKGGNTGTKAPGAACMMDNECAPDSAGTATCQFGFSGNAETRTCQIQIVGKAGDNPCIATIDGNITTSGGSGMPPARGYTCDRKDNIRCDFGSKMCTQLLDVGGACTFGSLSDNPCVKTAYCDTAMKQCAPREPVGAACDTFSTGQCADGSYCDSMAKRCTMSLAEGAACSSSEACASRSCVNSTCAKNGSGDLGLQLICGKS